MRFTDFVSLHDFCEGVEFVALACLKILGLATLLLGEIAGNRHMEPSIIIQ